MATVQTTETNYKYRWAILGVLWIAYIVVFLHRLSVAPLAPFLKQDLHITSAQIGMVISAGSLGYTMTQIPVGWLVDRVGARWPTGIGELIGGAAMIALFFVPSYLWLLIFMFVVGLTGGSLVPATSQAVVIWFPRQERATAMGIKQTALNIGGIVSAATLPSVALAIGWRYGFLFLGIIAVIIGAIALLLYKDPPGAALLRSSERKSSAEAMPMLRVLKNRKIWLVSICGLCFSWVEFAVISHLVLYLTEGLLLSVVVAGGLLALSQAAGAIARPASGLLSDRGFGGARKPVFLLMAGTASAMCLLVGLFGYGLSWAIYPVLFLLGMGGIGFGAIFLTFISELGGRQGAGKTIGLGATVAMCGSIAGPIVFGHIVDTTGSYGLAWLSLAFIAAICVFLLLFVREEKKI